MSRKRRAPRRIFQPDSKYSSLVLSKFINFVMYDGKKAAAEKVIYNALDQIKEKTKEDPIKVTDINSGVNPKYNLSVFSAGYMGSLGKQWAFSSSYERWWYHGESSNNLNNTFSNTLIFSKKYFYASLDYSMLFGEGLAHRLVGTMTGSFNLGKWWKFKSIKIFRVSVL